MSSCFSWGYFLKKLGIRRKRARRVFGDTSVRGERQKEDLPEMPNRMQAQHLHQNNKFNVSLLHPDWRRFPHVPLYGWTNDHEQQLKHLNNMIVNGSLESAYYNSEIEYRTARFLDHFSILPQPNVDDVNEAILLLRRNHGFQYNSCCNESLAEYDADDESENNSVSLQRYYNHHKYRKHVVQQAAA